MDDAFNPRLPLFIYGALKPGEMAWPFMKTLISGQATEDYLQDHQLVLVDGIPSVRAKNNEQVSGFTVHLRPGAVEQLNKFENVGIYYQWALGDTYCGRANFLKVRRELQNLEIVTEWKSSDDMYFGGAIPYGNRVLSALLAGRTKGQMLDDETWFFELQTLFSTYWTLFERIILFTKGFSVSALEMTEIFKIVREDDLWTTAFSRGEPAKYTCQSNNSPYGSNANAANQDRLATWYCLRNNIIHRGKGALRDLANLEAALIDLHNTLAWYLQLNNASIKEKWQRQLTTSSQAPYSDGLYIIKK